MPGGFWSSLLPPFLLLVSVSSGTGGAVPDIKNEARGGRFPLILFVPEMQTQITSTSHMLGHCVRAGDANSNHLHSRTCSN